MRKTVVLFVLLALGLSSLVLASRDSVAQEEPASSLVCPAGWELDGEICVIDDGAQCPENGAYIGGGLCETYPEPLADLVCPDGAEEASVIDGCLVVFGDPDAPNPCPEFYEWTSVDCRRDFGPVPDVSCPDGFSPDDSLGGICARFEPAEQMPESCPEGARGVADACYILVARGPAGPTCPEGQVPLGGGCFIIGEPPFPGEPQCPNAPDIIQDGCYRLVAAVDGECPAGTAAVPIDDGVECREPVALIPGALMCEDGFAIVNGECIRAADPVEPMTVGPFPCEGETIPFDDVCLVVGAPPAPGPAQCPEGDGVMGNPDDGCWILVASGPDGACPQGSTPIEHEGAPACRRAVAAVPGALGCEPGYRLIDGVTCVIAADHVVTIDGPQCPNGSFEDLDRNCRKPVANAAGAYFCSDPAAALNGRSCVYTAPFILGTCDVGVDLVGRCVDIVDAPPQTDCSNADVPIAGGVCVEVDPLSVIECPPGSIDIGAGGGCVGEAEALCDEAVEGRCLRFVEPVVRGQISGQVRSFVDGSGIFGVQVCARNAFLGLESCSFSQADGTYYLPPLPPGNYQLRSVDFSQRYQDGCFGIGDCADPAWVGLGLEMERDELLIWLDPTGPVPTPTPTPIPPTPTPVVTPEPTPTPTDPVGDAPYLAGSIRSEGELLNGVEVCAEPLAFFFAPVCTTSGPNGEYLLEGLVSTNYHIVADGGEACYGPDSSCEAPELFGVTPTTALDDLVINLPDPVEPPDFVCPVGYTASIEFADCVRFEEPVVSNGSVCPTGARGSGAECYIFVAKGPSGETECSAGELIGAVCVLEGADPIQPPDADFLVCPDAGFAEANGRCVVFLPPTYLAPQCPVGSFEDSDGNCRRVVAPLVVPAGTLECVVTLGELRGDTCVIRYQELPEPFESCPVGYLYNTNLESCARYEPAAIADQARCPEAAFGVAGACFDFVAKGPSTGPFIPAQCPFGSIENADGNCMRPVDDIVGTDGEFYCASPGAVLSGDACFELALLSTATPSETPPPCPSGYSLDDSLNACARFAPAIDGSCPDLASELNGQSCVWAFAPWTPAPPVAPSCPSDYSIDTSYDGACARFTPADFDGEVYSCPDDGVLVSQSCLYFAGFVLPPPMSDADCAARNPDFPYFHEADGLCYATPIGVF